MAARKRPPTEFGLEVTLYCLKSGITKKRLAEIAEVSYETMKDAASGKRPAREVIQKVQKVMNG